ncbi:ABC transporter permease [Devosia rhodophyticola]|uniref:ABC transporter permease n=1 Tax=Devosia rhodophyticola TaxID=3026423 RepID=A0ABY7YYY7_9HYPH|nr:ABC transporter permease [Devosia rhodophyticola]WDR06454.1 ABC transporter permease [Devosia rhodophyticola]
MSNSQAAAISRFSWPRFDKLGVLIAAIALGGVVLPFMLFRANRIVLGEPRAIFSALPVPEAGVLALLLAAGMLIALLRFKPALKLAASLTILVALFVLVGRSAYFLTPPDDNFARVSPGAGFWLLVFAFALLAADALTRLRLKPWPRIGILALVALAIGVLLASGSLNGVSTLKEYATRADRFWSEAQTHVLLAFGSVLIATIVGVPVGIISFRLPKLRAALLNVLNIVQTIPSIALFGLLIAPLAWIAATVPGAAAIGISGIGVAPALVALFAYSLLPVVSNTIVGLQSVPETANDAAKGMGMTGAQRMGWVELPLAFPVILTGIRIVLVQNIGLTTIAALIGGGGFGVFIFQGISQTAMDLVLLGAVPTVVLAFAAAVVLDAFVEMTSTGGQP